MSFHPPLKSLFQETEPDFAWKLLDAELALDLSQSIHPNLVANLLQLYMLGVQKMNSYSDWRETFFKEKVMWLMSKSEVMKTLGKKKIDTQHKEQKNKVRKKDIREDKKVSKMQMIGKVISPQNEKLQLRQKKKQIETRLVYILQQNSIQKIAQAVEKQEQKQNILSMRVKQIFDHYEDRLVERINKRKGRSIFSNSISQPLQSNRSIHSSRWIKREGGSRRESKGCRSFDNYRVNSRMKKLDERRGKSLNLDKIKIEIVEKNKKQKQLGNTS